MTANVLEYGHIPVFPQASTPSSAEAETKEAFMGGRPGGRGGSNFQETLDFNDFNDSNDFNEAEIKGSFNGRVLPLL